MRISWCVMVFHFYKLHVCFHSSSLVYPQNFIRDLRTISVGKLGAVEVSTRSLQVDMHRIPGTIWMCWLWLGFDDLFHGSNLFFWHLEPYFSMLCIGDGLANPKLAIMREDPCISFILILILHNNNDNKIVGIMWSNKIMTHALKKYSRVWTRFRNNFVWNNFQGIIFLGGRFTFPTSEFWSRDLPTSTYPGIILWNNFIWLITS